MKRIIYLVFILIATAACKEVFETPPHSRMKILLLSSSTEKTTTSVVSVKGIGLDSLFYTGTSLNQMVLPLSSNDTTNFVISFDSVVDTLSVIHQTSIEYASMESGFYNEYKLQHIDFSHNRIDSVLITDSLVTKTWHENIKLYIRPLSSGSH